MCASDRKSRSRIFRSTFIYYTDIEIGHINYSDTNIGRMKKATIVSLARGCSLTQRELGAMLRFHQLFFGQLPRRISKERGPHARHASPQTTSSSVALLVFWINQANGMQAPLDKINLLVWPARLSHKRPRLRFSLPPQEQLSSHLSITYKSNKQRFCG